METTIIICIITVIGNIIISAISNKKTTALIVYRLEELEKKVDKHNTVIERVYELEKKADVFDEKIKVANNRLLDLEKKVEA